MGTWLRGRFRRSRPRRGNCWRVGRSAGDQRRQSEADTMAKLNSGPDAVSAAMSAIEDALNLTEDETAAPASGEHAFQPPPLAPAKPATAAPVLKPSAPAAETAPLLRPSAPSLAPSPETEAQPSIPATPPPNDDRETFGAVFKAMNVRPANRP